MELAACPGPVPGDRRWVHSHFNVGPGVARPINPNRLDTMEHLSLYRKWRPQTFTEVVGQGRVTNTLANAFTSGRLVHAYLFSGPRGTGKTSTARILAKAMNCVEGPTATPCGTCEACVSISEGTALDVIEIDAASNRKIDEIRDLLDKIPYTPTSLRSKVYIIDEVHQLTPEASSALLKTLEEPPGHVVFVLATTEPHKLLPTIISRCQKFDFSLVSAQDMAKLLGHIAQREEINIDPDAIAMVAEHAHGSVRDAVGVMDQISNLSGERITPDDLADLLGEVETGLVFDMVDLIARRDTPATLLTVGRLVDDGKDPRRFVESLISHLRSLFLVQNSANPQEIVEATEEHYTRLTEQAGVMRRHEVVRLMERLGDAHREMRWSENPRLVLECALVKITSLDADATLQGLAFRIDELERKLEALGGGGAIPSPEKRPAGRHPGTEQAAPAGGRAATSVPGSEKPSRPKSDAERILEAVKPEAERQTHTAPHAQGTSAEREKDRRAWMAVLAEIKNSGQMKLWTLLARARVISSAGGELVLGFGDDATFQMEALKEADLARVAEVWERFVGEKAKVRTTSTAGKAQPQAKPVEAPEKPRAAAKPAGPSRASDAFPAPPAQNPETGRPHVHTEPQDVSDEPKDVSDEPAEISDEPLDQAGDPPKTERTQASSATEDEGDQAEAPSGKKTPAEIAKIFKERFDGEIIEETTEGKE